MPDTGQAGPAGVPPVLLAAAVLAAQDVSFLLVGSAALWLRGEQVAVGDLDAVIEPGGQNLRRLHAALAEIALGRRGGPALRSFRLRPLVTVVTSFGVVDCLLERGSLDWERLRRPAAVIQVADAGVLVASAADTWELRRRFKGSRAGRARRELRGALRGKSESGAVP